MKRLGKPCNTDQERARKRATTDLRCAAKKLGVKEATRVLIALAREQSGPAGMADVMRIVADEGGREG